MIDGRYYSSSCMQRATRGQPGLSVPASRSVGWRINWVTQTRLWHFGSTHMPCARRKPISLSRSLVAPNGSIRLRPPTVENWNPITPW